ncbi:MutS-related protein [Lichenibacterium dinghuense]|uniref:MutS-related protein n=1 Tax=Lichenibacterium dinghuense TaxID=2895977 RepID=UPI001F23ECEB|nr:DNA mismatch repair protein MutS [Lichenibacterium sp. 6Y81]
MDARTTPTPATRAAPGTSSGNSPGHRCSLLWHDGRIPAEDDPQPAWFHDLALDQLVASLTAGREFHDLAPLYHRHLLTSEAVIHRQDAMRDIEAEGTAAACEAFATAMRRTRDAFARTEKRYHELQKQRFLLEGLEAYCAGTANLAQALDALPLASEAFLGLRTYVADLLASDGHVALRSEVNAIVADLAAVHYDVRVYGGGFRVERHAGEHDQGAEVEELFAKFRQGDQGKRPGETRDAPQLNAIEEQILEFVARLHPKLFGRLAAAALGARDAVDRTLVRIDREIQFFLAYREAVAPMRRVGLPFCFPIVTSDKTVRGRAAFDVVLAARLVGEGRPVVTNGFDLHEGERIFLVSGPNQGGKTTFARTFGQMHHLAALGLPVPGLEAKLHLFDAIHTHFEREEQVADRRSKLEDDLVRVRSLLEAATPGSIIILNEIFSSTTLDDAVFLGSEVVRRIVALDGLCVLVTFLDELVGLSPTIVSAVSTVVPEDPARRTFEVVRRPADGRSYALSVAEKYRLTFAELSERLRF